MSQAHSAVSVSKISSSSSSEKRTSISLMFSFHYDRKGSARYLRNEVAYEIPIAVVDPSISSSPELVPMNPNLSYHMARAKNPSQRPVAVKEPFNGGKDPWGHLPFAILWSSLVQYRRGRLFPKYRPAASPTFISSLHSNNYRKVIEMRSKANRREEVVELLVLNSNNNMVGSGFWGGIENVCGDDFFENVLNVLDFPMENVEDDGLVEDWDAMFKSLGPIPSEGFPFIPLVNAGNSSLPFEGHVLRALVHCGNGDGQGRPRKLPYASSGIQLVSFLPLATGPVHATTELKPMPKFVENSSPSVCLNSSDSKESSVLQAPSPNSVLESSSSCSAEKSMTLCPELVIPVRTRSKRARPLASESWFMKSPISFPSPKKIPCHRISNEKRIKNWSHLSGDMETKEKSTKKCAHCAITKTPQWREGPMGPKTLCNACGVRYRSGRLLPEYRPAASPTFVPSLHSNSHKKVIQMRNKVF
ncbi:hypothetical protein RJ640_006044 [Escallonia rubra]|uniref:GATA-type domain-containing protein n=1 Tax=Escallonia rubra TaxID=112253 RepID=A0AA88UAZ7_9ASTE|nr:hypothetical protein RJ640_006044 [Escallonia rubra]